MLSLITHLDYSGRTISIEVSETAKVAVRKLVDSLTDGVAIVEIRKYYRHRSTGPLSQNHHINGHIKQIAQETGNDYETVKWWCKNEAVSAGYPTDMIADQIVPWSESRLDSLQAAILIDTIHRLAAELGITLREV